MPHLNSKILLDIYYTSIDPNISRFARTASDSNTFVTLANQLLKRRQKQGSKHRSITPKLKKKSFLNILLLLIFLQTHQIILSYFLFALSWGFTYNFFFFFNLLFLFVFVWSLALNVTKCFVSLYMRFYAFLFFFSFNSAILKTILLYINVISTFFIFNIYYLIY